MQSYRDLKVWQEAMNVAEFCYKATKAFPKEETYGMIAQIRRAAASVPANIAEVMEEEHVASIFNFYTSPKVPSKS
nr:four helix bundle protein [Nostoc piscinale]